MGHRQHARKRKSSAGRTRGDQNQHLTPSRSPTLPNVIVHKAKHIIPVRDAIKYSLYSSPSGQASPNRQSATAAGDTSFGSTSSPPKHSPPPPPITPSTTNKSSTLPAHGNPLYQSLTSQLSAQNQISLNRLMAHPYFTSGYRSHYLLNNSARRSTNEKKSLSNSFTNSNSQPDQAQDHSTNSTLKSYLSDRNVSNSNPTTQTNTNSVSPNKSSTLTKQPSARRASRRSQRGSGTANKRLSEEQLRQKLVQYELYIASQLDKVDSVEKKNAQEKKPKMTDEEWQKLVFNRIFLGANSILLLCAFIMLALACILDPNPIHKLDSKGGFYAFNAVVFIFLSLLGLYGMRPLRKKLLLAYASAIAFLLVFRLITGLVMLIALENNQSELIFLLSAGLIEMMLAILALANAMNDQQEFSKLPPSSSAVDGGALPTPIQVLCKDDSKPFASDKNRMMESKSADNHAYSDNSFSKSSTLRRSMNANHAPRPPMQPTNQSPITGLQTTAGELIYVSPDNLVFNERSVDAPAEPKKLGNRSFNYAANLTQYSTISKLLDVAKRNPKPPTASSTTKSAATLPSHTQNGGPNGKANNGELITRTTLVAKPFQLSKDLSSSSKSRTPINRSASEISQPPARPSPAVNYSTISHHPSRKSEAAKPENAASSAVKSAHKRQPSTSFLTNASLPYRTSTPSNNLPPSIQAIDGYSPQNTTGSNGTSKASIFDYNYSPINLNQISHHILSGQKPPATAQPANGSSDRPNKLPTTLSALRQNILQHKMNFLNNNSYNPDQYKQTIINQVVNETEQAQRSPYASATNKWPRY